MAASAAGDAGVTHESALAFVAENTEKDEARSTAVKIFIENTVCTAKPTALLMRITLYLVSDKVSHCVTLDAFWHKKELRCRRFFNELAENY